PPCSSPSRTSASIAARNAVSVLPEPVGAATRVLRPAMIAGHAATCASVGPGKAASNQRATAGWNATVLMAGTAGERQPDAGTSQAARPATPRLWVPAGRPSTPAGQPGSWRSWPVNWLVLRRRGMFATGGQRDRRRRQDAAQGVGNGDGRPATERPAPGRPAAARARLQQGLSQGARVALHAGTGGHRRRPVCADRRQRPLRLARWRAALAHLPFRPLSPLHSMHTVVPDP